MKWKVRGGMFYRSEDGKMTHNEGETFEATEKEVEHMRSHLEVAKPEPPPVVADEPPRPRRGRPPKNRSMSQPPFTTAM